MNELLAILDTYLGPLTVRSTTFLQVPEAAATPEPSASPKASASAKPSGKPKPSAAP